MLINNCSHEQLAKRHADQADCHAERGRSRLIIEVQSGHSSGRILPTRPDLKNLSTSCDAASRGAHACADGDEEIEGFTPQICSPNFAYAVENPTLYPANGGP